MAMFRDAKTRISTRRANEIARSYSSDECWIETEGDVILLCRRGRDERVQLHPEMDMTEDGIRSVGDWTLDE
ncbi:MAG TPA: hypothetical protein VMV10_15355 [Pirellulales bacterium]|nr:hypothetical protein [Pirellulales bacterium]